MQANNAPIHKARIIMKYLQDKGAKVLKWPRYSPYLNPIEHLWFILKEMVYKVNPDIEKVTGDQEIREALGKALNEAWKLIPEKRFKALWKRYDKRIDAVCKSKGLVD